MGLPAPTHKHLLPETPDTYCRVPVCGRGHWTDSAAGARTGSPRSLLFPKPGAGHVGGVARPQPGLGTAMQLAALRLREGSPRELGKQTPETPKPRLRGEPRRKSSSRNKPLARARIHTQTQTHRYTHIHTQK